MSLRILRRSVPVFVLFSWLLAGPALAQDRLPSWNDGPARQAIVDFVKRVTTKGSTGYVPLAERIAVFDNDGTLWADAEKAYGIPPEQVVGGTLQQKFEMRNGTPVLLKLPAVDFIDDKEGKPVAIQKFIGRLDKALDEARARGWTVVDMQRDWKAVFPLSKAGRAP